MTIGASPAQRGLLYALVKQAGEGHAHIKDRASRIGLESVADMTLEQARILIREYQDVITPPPPIQPTRANFFNLPKRVAKSAAPPSNPAMPVSAAPMKPKPASREPIGVNRFDPDLKIVTGDGIEDIPW